MEDKRKVKITIEIDDCKDCPHYVLLAPKAVSEEKRDDPKRHICGVTDTVLASGEVFQEVSVPADCPLLEIQKLEEDDNGREYWKATFCEDGCSPEITWEEFQELYFKCSGCNSWVSGPHVCQW